MLDKAFNRKINRGNNMESKEEEILFSCNTCKKTFLTEDCVKAHIMTHDKETPLVCEEFETFRGVDQENHLDTHIGDTVISCNTYEKTFLTEDSVKAHIKTHDKETPLICEEFDETITGVDQENHIHTQTVDTLFSCNMCEKTFLTEDSVKTHLATHEKTPLVFEVFDETFSEVNQENNIETHMGDTLFSCNICKKTFSTENSVKTHVATHDEETHLVCEIFDKTFKGVDQENHIETQKGETLFSCNMCEKTFSTEDSVKTHITTHVEDTPLVCKVFDETFRNIDEENHMEINEEETLFSCDLCKTIFSTKDGLRNHIMTHEETSMVDKSFSKEIGTGTDSVESSFSCNICKKTFLTKDVLNSHITTHNTDSLTCKKFDETLKNIDQENHIETYEGKTLFPCDICKTSFSTKNGLENHIITHEETSMVDKTSRKKETETDLTETPFSCNICKKTFSTEDVLKTHITIHDQKTALVSKVFDKTSKKVEVETHTEETSISCNICKNIFLTNDSLNIHIKTHDTESLLFCKVFDETCKSINQENHVENNEIETLFLCDTCKTSFSTKNGLKNHIMTHEDTPVVDKNFSQKKDSETDSAESLFSCNICQKTFSVEDGLKNHIITHEETSVVCDVLDKTSSRKIDIKTHTTKTTFSSNMSDRAFPAADLKSRFKSQVGENPFVCEVCGKEFSRKAKLKSHMRTHNGKNSYCCSMCEKNSSHNATEEARSHSQMHTGENAGTSVGHLIPNKNKKVRKLQKRRENAYRYKIYEKNFSHNSAEARFSCQVCDETFFEKGDLEVHVKSHTEAIEIHDICFSIKKELNTLDAYNEEIEKMIFRCEVCNDAFLMKDDLEAHLKSHAKVTPFKLEMFDKDLSIKKELDLYCLETQTMKSLHTCTICDKTFSKDEQLKRHMRIHTGERPFSCTLCGKGFSYNCTLKNHMRIHTNELPFLCAVCNKAFSRKDKLQVHIRTHTGETPYSCGICGKSFSHRSSLNAHVVIHTGESAFVCEVCAKAFSRKEKLKLHMRTHTGETPYPCTICNKAFSYNCTLKNHMKIHTGELPFPCAVCGKAFSRKDKLQSHGRIHTGETPYPCKLCNRAFSHNVSLKTHMRIHAEEISVCM